MKKIISYSLFLFLSLAFVVSCGPSHDYTNEFKAIESCRADLVRLDSTLSLIKPAEVDNLVLNVNNTSGFVQSAVNKIGETIDFKTAEMLTEFRSLRKPLDAVSKNSNLIRTSIDSTAKNLERLENDLRKNTLSEGLSAADCVKRERENLDALAEQTQIVINNYVNSKLAFDSLQPKVMTYAQQLNAKITAQPK
jgi:RNase adaptor protein for sRNA GlmZ degradation